MQIAQEKGAVAVIELYRLPFPWEFFKLFFNKENLVVADQENKEDNSIVYGWIKEKEEDDTIKNLQDGKKVKSQIASSGFIEKDCRSQNVIGVIEGTDPVLKEEYIIITAHYDHVGTGKNGGGAYSPEDSIFNGARDNAMGTVALMAAAKSLALQPIKRSVIILAVTGEELGLLGSQYYAEHPIIPLEKTIFNLNTDGAGYNDVSYVSVVGYGRTGTDELIDASANVFGLEVFPNPAPEQNLFDRSDNVSFAQKGVPAVCFSPGMTSFDDTVAKYYHQVADNPDTIDFDYLHKFCQSLARAARLIGDREELPQWKAGDKYEEAGKSLYNE
jgi:Zn-dependent M28 family amino/carboxypeptidase